MAITVLPGIVQQFDLATADDLASLVAGDTGLSRAAFEFQFTQSPEYVAVSSLWADVEGLKFNLEQEIEAGLAQFRLEP